MPTAFEFNGRFLATLMYHTTSCQFGSFLCDCERQRAELRLRLRSRSVWEALGGSEMLNRRYEPTEEVQPWPLVRFWLPSPTCPSASHSVSRPTRSAGAGGRYGARGTKAMDWLLLPQ